MHYFNYHTHTCYCDGSSIPLKYIEKALEFEFSALGFSAHSPLPFKNEWSIKADQMSNYASEINDLKETFSNKIEIYLGLEMDFIPGTTANFYQMKKNHGLDYCIGSVHLVKQPESSQLWFIDGPEKGYTEGLQTLFDNNPRKAVTAYYNQICAMTITEKPDIIGHLDKVKMHNHNRYFSEEEQWYKDLISQTLKLISKSGSIVEINTRGVYTKRTDSLFPGIPVLEQCFHMDIPVTISSDSHQPEELRNYYNETMDIIKSIGFKFLYKLNGKTWVKTDIR